MQPSTGADASVSFALRMTSTSAPMAASAAAATAGTTAPVRLRRGVSTLSAISRRSAMPVTLNAPSRAPQRGASAQGAQCRRSRLSLDAKLAHVKAGMKLKRPIWLGVAALACAGAAVLALGALTSRREADPPCATREFEGSRFIVCTFDARRHQLRLASQDANGVYLRSFSALETSLGRDAGRVRFAMNAGMFNAAGAPIGLYVSEGRERHVLRLTDGPGNFHMKPNGVFWIDRQGLV